MNLSDNWNNSGVTQRLNGDTDDPEEVNGCEEVIDSYEKKCQEFQLKLIELIYDINIIGLKDFLDESRVKFPGEEFIKVINEKDKNGWTPLILATNLAYKDRDSYQEIIKILLENNANPLKVDKLWYKAIKYALEDIDINLVSQLFDYHAKFREALLLAKFKKIADVLKGQKNFKLEIFFDIDSSIIPLVHKFTPSDTYKIVKYGDSLRFDSTLVGFKGLKSKRRPISFLFNPINPKDSKHTEAIKDNRFKMWNLSHEKKTFSDPLEIITSHEKTVMITDYCVYLEKDHTQLDEFKMEKTTQSHAKGLFGGRVSDKIYDKETAKWDLDLKMRWDTYKDYDRRKKFNISQNDYTKAYEPDYKPEVKEIHKSDIKSNKMKTTVGIWISPEFGITLKEILPTIEIFETGNELFQKLKKVLTEDLVEEIMAEGFPIKIQIPITMTVRANVFFKHYEELVDGCYDKQEIEKLFEIPHDYTRETRANAQKFFERKSKRYMLSHILL